MLQIIYLGKKISMKGSYSRGQLILAKYSILWKLGSRVIPIVREERKRILCSFFGIHGAGICPSTPEVQKLKKFNHKTEPKDALIMYSWNTADTNMTENFPSGIGKYFEVKSA